MGIEADSEGRWRRRLSGDKGPPFLVGTHIRVKPEPGNLPPRKTLLVLPTDGKWVRAVRNEPNGLLAAAKASILVLSQMRTVVGVGRGRRQLGRVFSLGRNSLPLLGLGNAHISHVSKNKAKGSVLFDPRVGRGKLAHKRVFYVLSVMYSPLPNSHPQDGVNILYTFGTAGLVMTPRVA